MVLAYAFNHDEAIRSLTHALNYDPSCITCYWALSLFHSPNINRPLTLPSLTAAKEALHNATTLLTGGGGVAQWEEDVITALLERFPPERVEVDDGDDDGSGGSSSYDVAYADAMKELSYKYPDDPDVLSW